MTRIRTSVYDDKIMIWNPGQLPEDWTVEKLTGKHSSEPRNPDIANALFRAGMIERGFGYSDGAVPGKFHPTV